MRLSLLLEVHLLLQDLILLIQFLVPHFAVKPSMLPSFETFVVDEEVTKQDRTVKHEFCMRLSLLLVLAVPLLVSAPSCLVLFLVPHFSSKT